jgi:hypothetical protein
MAPTPARYRGAPDNMVQVFEHGRECCRKYFVNINRRPEEVIGFQLVDALMIAIVNEVMEGKNLYQEYRDW